MFYLLKKGVLPKIDTSLIFKFTSDKELVNESGCEKIINTNCKLMKAITCILCSFVLQNVYSQTHKTYFLIVGMEYIDSKAYYARYKKSFSNQATSGVANDVRKMKMIGERNEHVIKELMNTKATVSAIKKNIEDIGNKVEEGDTFIFYFSGHGDILKDTNGDEITGFDQALVAYDDFLIDDAIYELLNKYFKKTNNVMIVDACHSSTSYKFANYFMDFKTAKNKALKFANEEKAIQFEKLQTETIELQGSCAFGEDEDISEAFNLIYIGATEDENPAGGNINGGLLTICLDMVINRALASFTWNNYTYPKMACEVAEQMANEHQNLQYHEIGISVDNYAQKTPFKIF